MEAGKRKCPGMKLAFHLSSALGPRAGALCGGGPLSCAAAHRPAGAGRRATGRDAWRSTLQGFRRQTAHAGRVGPRAHRPWPELLAGKLLCARRRAAAPASALADGTGPAGSGLGRAPPGLCARQRRRPRARAPPAGSAHPGARRCRLLPSWRRARHAPLAQAPGRSVLRRHTAGEAGLRLSGGCTRPGVSARRRSGSRGSGTPTRGDGRGRCFSRCSLPRASGAARAE